MQWDPSSSLDTRCGLRLQKKSVTFYIKLITFSQALRRILRGLLRSLQWRTGFVFQVLSSTTVTAMLTLGLVWQQTERDRNMFSIQQNWNTAMTSIQGLETHVQNWQVQQNFWTNLSACVVSLQPTFLEIWICSSKTSLDWVPTSPVRLKKPQKCNRACSEITWDVTTSLKISNSNVIR